MAHHPEYWPAIDAEADGALAPEESSRLQAHLATCADCAGRLELARREVRLLGAALAPPEPPPGFASAVMARVEGRDARTGVALRPALLAGIVGNLVTAAMLLALSVGSGASVPLMLLVAVAGAVVWGGVKGLAFAGVLRFLPGGVVVRGLLFGLGVWALVNGLLAIMGGLGGDAGYSPSFVLLGSLVHHALYGVLLSWLYGRFDRPADRGRMAAE